MMPIPGTVADRANVAKRLHFCEFPHTAASDRSNLAQGLVPDTSEVGYRPEILRIGIGPSGI